MLLSNLVAFINTYNAFMLCFDPALLISKNLIYRNIPYYCVNFLGDLEVHCRKVKQNGDDLDI